MEMLTHECSHQVYQLASWFARMDLPDAPEVYSVLKERSRPLERLLLGFHAFGNCVLMYDALRQRNAPVDQDELPGRISSARLLVDSLHEEVAPRISFLSPAGQAIYKPLADRLWREQLLARPPAEIQENQDLAVA
jgi:HEXXH motif-containing protein